MSRENARIKATGEEKYTADVELSDLVHAVYVRSTMPHARILGIDATAALARPGVIGVYTAADFTMKLMGSGVHDVPIVARDKVRYVGERVAVVVAEDLRTARI